jgi:hypothetical protein
LDHAIDANLNLFVFFALIFMGLALVALLGAAVTLVPQVNRTLTAYEKLADTLEKELGPTLDEVKKVVVGVQELRLLAGKQMTDMTTKVEDVTGHLGKAATEAKKHSSVFGTGFLAGVKAYLEGGKKDHSKELGQETGKQDNRQITMDRGEENVGFKR